MERNTDNVKAEVSQPTRKDGHTALHASDGKIVVFDPHPEAQPPSVQPLLTEEQEKVVTRLRRYIQKRWIVSLKDHAVLLTIIDQLRKS
jgi:hypothetical protein